MTLSLRPLLIRGLLQCGLLLLPPAAMSAPAESAQFDLTGPTLQISVTRNDQTLPISQVPALAAGDRLVIKAELPEDQAARYLLVAAFLRGPTNPPPDKWFFECKTWKAACRKKGLELTVPQEAQQLLLFFAPSTGGDFKTVRNAVQGRPGAFVRSVQELNQATLDRLRLERYLEAVREIDLTDSLRLKEVAPLLARSLAIKVDEKCLDRAPALQAPCLMQGQNSLILNDGRGNSMVGTLTSGPASDLAVQAGSTPLVSGTYAPYIGSLLDLARLMDSFGTAHYQYIPALAMPRAERLNLKLNTPPSFHEPQSVLVAALPPIEVALSPLLHAVADNRNFCAARNPLLLPVDGAPLLYATQFSRNLVLTARNAAGEQIDLPVRADATLGGFVVDTRGLDARFADERLQATIHGEWGFHGFSGPDYVLVNPPQQGWAVAAGDETALVVGRENTLHVQAPNTLCVSEVLLRDAAGIEHPVLWKAVTRNQLELKVAMQSMQPGGVTLLIHQYGMAAPTSLSLNAYADSGRIDKFVLYAGDTTGVLKGSRLDQVELLNFKDVQFIPATLDSNAGGDVLTLQQSSEQAATFKAGEVGKATVQLKDGRTLKLDVNVAQPRPLAQLLARSVQPGSAQSGGANDQHPIRLAGDAQIAPDARLTFSIRALGAVSFNRDTAIEIATVDGAVSKQLTLAGGGFTLQNPRVAVVSMVPVEQLGLSAFGELRFRLVNQGIVGDWQRVGMLVRRPVLNDLQCPADSAENCELNGRDLFLIDALSLDKQFRSPVVVPDGYPGNSLSVPRPSEGLLYVKLRDDPSTVTQMHVTVPPSVDTNIAAAETAAPVSTAPAAK